MKFAVLENMTPCILVDTNVSEEPTDSIFGVKM
jgi:hypothetical protein